MEASSQLKVDLSELQSTLGSVTVDLWICPVDGSYYGSSADEGRDLRETPKRAKAEDEPIKAGPHTNGEQEIIERRGSRATCPHCAIAGRGRVERILKRVVVRL